MPLHLARRFAAAMRPPPSASTCWADTEPMAFNHEREPSPARPFRQVLAGLHVHEVNDEELFQRYFGAPGSPA